MQTANKCEHPMHTPKVQTFEMFQYDSPMIGPLRKIENP